MMKTSCHRARWRCPEMTDAAVPIVYLPEAGLNFSTIDYLGKRLRKMITSKSTAQRCVMPGQPQISSFTLLLVLLLALMGASARAQGATAVLTGTVVDTQGAHVGEADIQVTQLEQGFQRTVKSDEHGVFSVAA